MKKVNMNEHIKNRKFRKKEEDGSITTMLCLECNGMNKLHSIEEIGMFHDPLGHEPDNDGEDEDLTFEPEDMDNPDEDLVIIGSGYLDIKSNFGERPSMTNGEYAELGQKVVDQLHNGDKDAALNYIYSRINEDRDEEDEENEEDEMKTHRRDTKMIQMTTNLAMMETKTQAERQITTANKMIWMAK